MIDCTETEKALRQVSKMIRRLERYRERTTNPHRVPASHLRMAFDDATDHLKTLESVMSDRISHSRDR